MASVATKLMRMGGGDPFERARESSEAHRKAHGCGLYNAGPEVMQLAASYMRAANARNVLDLGCGLGYSTLWLAEAAGPSGTVVGIDSDAGHIGEARLLAAEAGLEDRIRYEAGEVLDVLPTLAGPFDAVHDDAWFASAPLHLEEMLGLLRPGGLLTMPNWFLLADAITGQPRNAWSQFAGPGWAVDTLRYAQQLADRRDLSVNWIAEPPLGVAVKA